MRIALRTSGGRGEYEISGSHGGTKAHDVIDHSIIMDLVPGHPIKTYNTVHQVQGKLRIRLDERSDTSKSKHRHVYLTLADALLLPKPKRALNSTPNGKLQLVDNGFSIDAIQFGIVRLSNSELVIRPDLLILLNNSRNCASVDVVERIGLLMRAWEISQTREGDELSALLKRHKIAFYSGDDSAIKAAALDVRQYIDGPDYDPLQWIFHEYQASDAESYCMGIHECNAEDQLTDEDRTSIQESARNKIKQWRQISVRGADAKRFSSNVREAYKHVCLFSGHRLPKVGSTESPGVDSAHIVPWAENGANSIDNGLCLDKLCHWAFDAGVLRLDFDKEKQNYVISIPEAVLTEGRVGLIDLSPFAEMVGVIPIERLPSDRQKWPNPKYLDEYNNAMFTSPPQ